MSNAENHGQIQLASQARSELEERIEALSSAARDYREARRRGKSSAAFQAAFVKLCEVSAGTSSTPSDVEEKAAA